MSLGCVGVGGNLLTVGSMHFPLLYKSNDASIVSRDGMLASIMSAAIQASGFVFVILPMFDFEGFFVFYAVLAAAGACITCACYPDVGYESNHQTPRWLQRCICSSNDEVLARAGSLLQHLKAMRTWLFLASFGLTATCSNWGLAIFFGVVAGPTQQNIKLVSWMPILANSTFIFMPCLGALIDAKGFDLPILSLGVWTAAFAMSMGFLPLIDQWLTVLALNMLQTHAFSLQFVYLNKTYPGSTFGGLMSLSCWAQSVINPISLL
mmetsp:Transcript_102040/g.329146  ORF Transcript_102040/g.329146 Transcript_102040/m.329146 type:complete len:265 (-) Transcript_102040:327-1121(-)